MFWKILLRRLISAECRMMLIPVEIRWMKGLTSASNALSGNLMEFLSEVPELPEVPDVSWDNSLWIRRLLVFFVGVGLSLCWV